MSDLIAGQDDRGILTRADGASIAYHRVACPKRHTRRPTVVFLHGLMSDMSGGKATFLAEEAVRQGFGFLRFDMFGHGQSSGAFTDGCISRWRDDTLAVIDTLTEGPLVLVGSSMGGWIMLLVALARPERIKSLIGIAPAPDFTENALWAMMTPEQRVSLECNGLIEINDGDDAYPISKNLITDGRDHLLLQAPIAYTGPVRILQGMADASVPWRLALAIGEKLTTPDTQITLIKDGDHSLSRPQDLALLGQTIGTLIADSSAEKDD